MKCLRDLLFLGVLIWGFRMNSLAYDGALSSEHWADENVIIDGESATKVVPYMASLQKKSGHHFCGGAIISNRHVVTAAHCFHTKHASAIVVVVGTKDKRKGQKHGVTHIFRHPRYCSNTATNDVALLKVGKAFDFRKPTVQPIRLERAHLKDNMPVMISGWGRTQHSPKIIPNILQISYETTIPSETCAAHYRRGPLDKSKFCSYNKSRTCKGDSGGPVVTRNTKEPKLVGVVSYGERECVQAPRVRTRLSSYLQFIGNTMKISF